jgi:hypothetical protein
MNSISHSRRHTGAMLGLLGFAMPASAQIGAQPGRPPAGPAPALTAPPTPQSMARPGDPPPAPPPAPNPGPGDPPPGTPDPNAPNPGPIPLSATRDDIAAPGGVIPPPPGVDPGIQAPLPNLGPNTGAVIAPPPGAR